MKDRTVNSEGEIGSFSSVVEIEGKQDFEEKALPQQRKDSLDGSDLLGPSDTGPCPMLLQNIPFQQICS